MIAFKESSFVIEVPTGGNPIEDWLGLHDDLIDVLQCQDEVMSSGKTHRETLELLRAMMPDWETAKKMAHPTPTLPTREGDG